VTRLKKAPFDVHLVSSMGAAAMLAWTICVLAVARLDGVEAQTEAAMTCSTAAATASTYSAATYAAAVIDYSDCTTNVVRVVTSSDGTTSLDLSSKQIVYVQSLPSVMSLYAGELAPANSCWNREITPTLVVSCAAISRVTASRTLKTCRSRPQSRPCKPAEFNCGGATGCVLTITCPCSK
jgi:hypothetical protein